MTQEIILPIELLRTDIDQIKYRVVEVPMNGITYIYEQTPTKERAVAGLPYGAALTFETVVHALHDYGTSEARGCTEKRYSSEHALE